MIGMQNMFLTIFRTIPVFGIEQHIIKLDDNNGTTSHISLHQCITQQPSINGIETTNRASDLVKSLSSPTPSTSSMHAPLSMTSSLSYMPLSI